MRCDRCGYSSPENHKFCGMCGLKLGRSASSVLIDDNDPLEIETSYPDDRSVSAREPIQFRERERRRESARDTSQSTNGSRRTSSAAIENLPPDAAQEEAANETRSRRSTNRSSGISGPSFLGLSEDSNNGFIYDKPDDGFVYDTATETPEYLLTEVSRGVSWRAWAFFLLLIVGGGLGYIQWRASHNQGPDIASILAGNGATVDPSGPDMTKPASLKPPTPPPDATNAAKNSVDQADSSGDSAKASSKSESSVAAKDSTESTKTGDTAGKGAAGKDDSKDEAAAAKSPKASASTDTKDKDNEEAAKPESDGPVAKATKSKRGLPAPVDDEEAPQPKSLGEKDPLIVQANKYLHARGARKNCSAAVNLLRQASSAGNPSADVKMGALYWSGTCVTQSNVTAYQWFARAHSLEPNNRWIERSRSSLWARLTPAERRRAGY